MIIIKITKFTEIWILVDYNSLYLNIKYQLEKWFDMSAITLYGLMMPYGDKDLGQHWLK